ncbi:hypothetical protein [Cellulomonas xylanilytica]|nr:hypothetical protein [Cellulomonas xylanilytica]
MHFPYPVPRARPLTTSVGFPFTNESAAVGRPSPVRADPGSD